MVLLGIAVVLEIAVVVEVTEPVGAGAPHVMPRKAIGAVNRRVLALRMVRYCPIENRDRNRLACAETAGTRRRAGGTTLAGRDGPRSNRGRLGD